MSLLSEFYTFLSDWGDGISKELVLIRHLVSAAHVRCFVDS
jgi:hypothetical protein